MIAIYRVLYGEEFIEQSIRSVLEHVDGVYVFYTNKVWGGCKGVNYKNKWVRFPDKFDNVVDVVRDMNEPKVKLIEDYYPTPFNQFTHLARRFDEPVVLMEPDMIVRHWPPCPFYPSAMIQVERWKDDYKIPQRRRPGPIFRRPLFDDCQANGWPIGYPLSFNAGHADNMGFCLSDEAMYWKHLTALAFSPRIGDSMPNPDWYENVWLKWTPEMRNLEISLGRESAIPYAR